MSKRYIDAEPLKSEIENTYIDGDSATNYRASADGDTLIGKFQVLDVIYDQPTADVQEVKHAHWEFLYETGRKHCSACKTEALCDRGSYSEHLSKYCPECGARMDEEETE